MPVRVRASRRLAHTQYILDLQRPLSSFTGVMEQSGYSVRVSGEEFTQFTPRYQFSNFIYLVRSDTAGQAFAQHHLDNITSMLHHCRDHGLIDQRSQRVALAALAYGPHGAAHSLAAPAAE